MPTVQVPLQPYTAITKLAKSKRFKELAAEKISLKQQRERVAAREEEVNAELYLVMDKDIDDDDTKSVEFEGYMLTKIDAGTTSKFSKTDLMKRPIRCTGCAECKKKKVTLFVTAVDIEACTTEGSRKPTVSAEKIDKDKKKK